MLLAYRLLDLLLHQHLEADVVVPAAVRIEKDSSSRLIAGFVVWDSSSWGHSLLPVAVELALLQAEAMIENVEDSCHRTVVDSLLGCLLDDTLGILVVASSIAVLDSVPVAE